MSVKHTPGPWEVDGSSICQEKGDRRVAWLTIPESEKRDEWQANARLIAASPCLLEALKSILESECAILTDLRNRARAAIAKATGEGEA